MSKFDNEILQVADDIRTITIQWATNIAREACKVMEKQLRLKKFSNKKELKDFFDRSTKLLIEARETEPMLRNWMKYARHKLKAWANAIELADAFAEYLTWINEEEKIRAEIGVNLIDDWDNIMTHCHSGSVTKILKTARDQWKKIHVYNTETRPLYQWRRTSTDLVKAGVPNTMVTDSSAAFFVDNIYEDDIDIRKVFLWADSIRSNWDTINKVWSFAIALSAWHSGIPLYVVWSLLKLDISGEIWIETRDGKELRSDAPEGLKILNYAFDMIPAKCITGIITEFWIIRPENLLKEVKKRYPWMLE
jgi:ribose 1,5-bisphosphate isomerase